MKYTTAEQLSAQVLPFLVGRFFGELGGGALILRGPDWLHLGLEPRGTIGLVARNIPAGSWRIGFRCPARCPSPTPRSEEKSA